MPHLNNQLKAEMKSRLMRAAQKMFIGFNFTTGQTIWTFKRIASVESLACGEKTVCKLEGEVQVLGVRRKMRPQRFQVNIITEGPWMGLDDKFTEW